MSYREGIPRKRGNTPSTSPIPDIPYPGKERYPQGGGGGSTGTGVWMLILVGFMYIYPYPCIPLPEYSSLKAAINIPQH